MINALYRSRLLIRPLRTQILQNYCHTLNAMYLISCKNSYQLQPRAPEVQRTAAIVLNIGSTPKHTKRTQNSTRSLSHHRTDAGRHHRRSYHRKKNRSYRWYRDRWAQRRPGSCAPQKDLRLYREWKPADMNTQRKTLIVRQKVSYWGTCCTTKHCSGGRLLQTFAKKKKKPIAILWTRKKYDPPKHLYTSTRILGATSRRNAPSLTSVLMYGASGPANDLIARVHSACLSAKELTYRWINLTQAFIKIRHLLTFTQAWNLEILKTRLTERQMRKQYTGHNYKILFGQFSESTHCTPQAILSKNLLIYFIYVRHYQ